MKNLFIRLRSWYTANRKYDGFVGFVVFGFGSIFLLVCNIVTDATMVDWLIWLIWMQAVLYHAFSWQKDKHRQDLFEFYDELLRHTHESEYAAIENSEQYHCWLVSANRRRKRAEKQLKWYRNTLRKESADLLGFKLKADEYEEMLFTAYVATYDYSVKARVTSEDVAHAQAARIRFNEYMAKHYTEIARRKFWRDYKQDLFDCLFLGDSAGDTNSKSH